MRVNENNPSLVCITLDGNGSPIYNFQGTPFTGIVEGFHPNGAIEFEEEYQNGYREGWIRYYYDNGQLNTEYQDHNNVLVPGTYKEYDGSGNLIHTM